MSYNQSNMPDVYSADKQNQAETAADVAKVPLVNEILHRVGEAKRSAAGGAYVVTPGRGFYQMQNDEEIVLLLRAHPIVNIRWIIFALLMLMVPTILKIFAVFDLLPYRLAFVGQLAWYLIILGYAFEKFLYWYFTVVIVTNERVVDVDFINLLNREITYANLNHIEEPALSSVGFIRSIFHMGDVTISTAADKGPKIEADNVPYPDRVVRIISELSEELEKKRERGE